MSDTILALLGFATVIAVIVLLLRNVTVPALAFVSVSTITAAILVATGAFTLDEMAGFIKEGVKGVHGTAVPVSYTHLNQLRKVALETLKNLDIDNVRITIVDKGALDCTLTVSYTHLDVYKRQTSTRPAPSSSRLCRWVSSRT